MQKRTKAERLQQQQADSKLAVKSAGSAYNPFGAKSNDGARKIFENKIDPMQERKLTYQSKDYDLRNKRYDTYSLS